MDHMLKVEPNSEAERYLMELINKIGEGHDIICRLGILFGESYNTYIFCIAKNVSLEKIYVL